jgi:hypothetical protein
MTSKYISTGLSLPVSLMQKIDTERGDISRSRFIFRLLEKSYGSAKEFSNPEKNGSVVI